MQEIYSKQLSPRKNVLLFIGLFVGFLFTKEIILSLERGSELRNLNDSQ